MNEARWHISVCPACNTVDETPGPYCLCGHGLDVVEVVPAPVVTDEMVERAALSWWNGERAGYDLPPQTLELASRDGAWEQYEARMEAALLAALDGEPKR